MTEKQKKFYTSKKNSIYVDMLKDMSPEDVDGDVLITLTTLRNYGIKTAVGSSSRNAKLILKKTDLRKYFDAVSDGTNISKPKPDPEVFLKASRFIGIEPKDCIVVEDAVAGIDAAANAGMDSAAIASAAGYEVATYSLNELSDLLKVIV
jgi:HAD superfamily hydrolase (TIGR01509 family)